jgi:hypothetical protein
MRTATGWSCPPLPRPAPRPAFLGDLASSALSRFFIVSMLSSAGLDARPPQIRTGSRLMCRSERGRSLLAQTDRVLGGSDRLC